MSTLARDHAAARPQAKRRRAGPARAGHRQGPGRALTSYVAALVVADLALATAITPLLPHLAGPSKTAGGILMAAYPLGSISCALPAGMLTGRLGARATVLLGLAGTAGAGLVFGWSSPLAMLIAARFAQGAAGGCTWAGGLAWLAGATPAERRGSALGTALGFAAAGTLAGPAVGAFASWVGRGPAFTAAAGACTVLMLASFLVPSPRDRGTLQLLPSARVLCDRSIGVGTLLTLLGGMAVGTLEVLAPLRLGRLGAGAMVIAAAFFAAGAAETVLSPLAGRLCDRRGEMAPARLLLAAGAGMCLVFPLLGQAGWLVVLLAAGMPAYGSLCVPASTLLSKAAERLRMHEGLVFGLVNFAWSSGQAAAAAAAGAVAQATSDLVPGVLLAIVSLVAVAVLRPGSPLRPAPHATAADP